MRIRSIWLVLLARPAGERRREGFGQDREVSAWAGGVSSVASVSAVRRARACALRRFRFSRRAAARRALFCSSASVWRLKASARRKCPVTARRRVGEWLAARAAADKPAGTPNALRHGRPIAAQLRPNPQRTEPIAAFARQQLHSFAERFPLRTGLAAGKLVSEKAAPKAFPAVPSASDRSEHGGSTTMARRTKSLRAIRNRPPRRLGAGRPELLRGLTNLNEINHFCQFAFTHY